MDVVSCFEMDVLGVDCAAFDCHVFFSDNGSCLSSGDPASSCFFGNGFRMVFPSGAAQADIDSYGIVLVNGFICLLIFLYVSCVHSCLQGIQGFQPAVSHFSGSLYGSGYVSCRIIYMILIFFLP